MRNIVDHKNCLWQLRFLKATPTRKQYAPLSGHAQCPNDQSGRLLRFAVFHAAKANINRRWAIIKELLKFRGWLPFLLMVQEPITGDVSIFRPVSGTRQNMATVTMQHRHRIPI
jgi:hypothetical protein